MSIAPPLRLSKRTVDALTPRDTEYVAWDAPCRALASVSTPVA